MRALVICFLPPPRPGIDVHGTYRRVSLHMHALNALGAEIEAVYYVTEEQVPRDADLAIAALAQEAQVRDYWGFPARVRLIRRRERRKSFVNEYLRGVISVAEQPALYRWAGPDQAAAIGALLDTTPDIVLVTHLHAMAAVLRSGRRPRRMLFDLDDVQHRVRLRWCLQRPRYPGKLLQLAHIPALFAATLTAARRSRVTFVCSEHDRAHLAGLGVPRVEVLPNAIPVPAAPVALASSPTMLFVGPAGHLPNAEAAERMVTRIFPLIRAARPDARLILAGGGTEALPSRAAAPAGVEYLGFVPDLRPVYAESRVFVCPMLNGGGTRLKLIEAAGHGLAIVSTTMGAEGLELPPDDAILLRDDDGGFADACLRLFQDDALAARLGASARARMQTLYDASSITAHLRDRIEAELRQ